MKGELKDRILADVLATPSPTRVPSQFYAWLVLPSSIIVAAALFFTFDGLEHGKGRALWFFVASCLGWAAVAALSVWGAFVRGRSAVGRARAVLMAVAIGTPAILFAMMFGLAVAHPEVTLVHPERIGFKCLGLTMAAAAFPLVALALVRQESDPVHPVATGAALGSACGASAGVMVEMWCPVGNPQHVVIGHILPIVLMSILGAALGARIIAMRGGIRQRPRR
jgi:hypothetical protein